MSELPRFAKTEIVSCLRDVANARLQQETWIHGRPGGPASPSELVSQLFDDTALGDYLDRGQPVFSPRVDSVLRSMSERVETMDLWTSPARLLEDPRWLELQQKAAEAVSLIEQEEQQP